jgi:hypothetical protein
MIIKHVNKLHQQIPEFSKQKEHMNNFYLNCYLYQENT